MFRRQVFAGVALAALAAVGIAGEPAASGPTPFKGTLSGIITRTPIPPLVKVDVAASGNATHLGRHSLGIDAIADPVAQTASGTYAFTAANGDKVYASFTGVSEPTDIPDVAFVVETATITGGTGRFANATGSFVVERYANRATGETYGSFEGTIQK